MAACSGPGSVFVLEGAQWKPAVAAVGPAVEEEPAAAGPVAAAGPAAAAPAVGPAAEPAAAAAAELEPVVAARRNKTSVSRLPKNLSFFPLMSFRILCRLNFNLYKRLHFYLPNSLTH